MPNRHNVPILNHVLLALKSKQSFLLQRLHASMRYKIVVMADFRADEMIGKIGMNDARGVLCVRSARDGPCAAFFFADGKKRNQWRSDTLCG